MQSDEVWHLCGLQVAADSILDLRPELVERVRLGEDGVADGSGLVSTLPATPQ